LGAHIYDPNPYGLGRFFKARKARQRFASCGDSKRSERRVNNEEKAMPAVSEGETTQ